MAPVAASAVEEAEHEVQDAGDDPLQQIAQVVLKRFGPQIPCAEGIATLADVEARQQAAYALAAAQRERSQMAHIGALQQQIAAIADEAIVCRPSCSDAADQPAQDARDSDEMDSKTEGSDALVEISARRQQCHALAAGQCQSDENSEQNPSCSHEDVVRSVETR